MEKEPRQRVVTKNLTTGYKTRHGEIIVSRNVCETLGGGELTCLLGPNGAGKSTILKTLSAFIPPLGGTIEIDGKKLSDYSDKELSKVIGVVLTERPSVTNLTVWDLVALGRSPYTGFWGGLGEEDREVVEESLNQVGINFLKERKVSTLSDGERQKTMIAKVLAQETPVIFLDEPTAFLDYPSKVEILRLLKKLASLHDKAIFLSTHDLEIALQISDRIWLMDKTLGLECGTTDELSANGSVGRYFNREGLIYVPEGRKFEIEI